LFGTDTVKQLAVNYKPIFTIQDEPPNWPSGSDDDLGFESISEQDTDSHGEADEFEDSKKKQPGEDPGEEEEFYQTPSPDGSIKEDRKSSLELETEEDSDPMRPVTPGETSYDGERGAHQTSGSRDLSQEERSSSSVGEDDDDNGDDDDGWVDPSVSPSSALVHLPSSGEGAPPPIAKSKSGNGKKPSKARSKKKTLVLPSSSPPAQSYPFPRSVEDMPPSPSQPQMPEPNSRLEKAKRMHTARARDGGRTQSGGVKGVID
jgi:cysteine protease ATG4